MDTIIEIKFKTKKFEMLTKFPFIGNINHLSISNRTRDMARNTLAVVHAGVSTCGWNRIGSMVASQLRRCQPCLIVGQHWLAIWEDSNPLIKIKIYKKRGLEAWLLGPAIPLRIPNLSVRLHATTSYKKS